MIALSADPSAGWPVSVLGHTLQIRALTSAEMLAAEAAAREGAPPDQYGQIVDGRLKLAHADRMFELRTAAIEAAQIADAAAKGGDPFDASLALGLADRALKMLTDEKSAGRARAEALLREDDPIASAALDRCRRHQSEPHRQAAARAIVAWPGTLKPGFSLGEALAALGPTALDPLGFEGVAVAEAITSSLAGRALDALKKGHSAPRSHSAGATSGAIRSSGRARGIAKPAKR